MSVVVRQEIGHLGRFLGNDQLYNSIITAHAFVIIFFIVIPMLVGAFGNYLVPLMLLAPDIAYPRLNNLRFWLLPGAIGVLLLRAVVDSGAGTR